MGYLLTFLGVWLVIFIIMACVGTEFVDTDWKDIHYFAHRLFKLAFVSFWLSLGFTMFVAGLATINPGG